MRLERHATQTFRIVDRETGGDAAADQISSGEAELISLGIEVLAFVRDAVPGRINLLLMDEPDVHLHPDLQDRLARFMVDALADKPVATVIATHSTALLASLADDPKTRVVFMRRGEQKLSFKPVTDVDRSILPVFGAHPLSNIFNRAPILLVEGEDDERVWQQAIRSAGGAIRLYPCVVDSVDRLAEFESEVNDLLGAVYDDARAYSLRDRDLHDEAIDDVGHVVRMRLHCRAAENLMLSDEALALAGTNRNDLQAKIGLWADANPQHQYNAAVRAFIDGGYDRQGADLKDIRNILIGLMSNKPWEVLVGQAIAGLARDGGPEGPNSLRRYLGPKASMRLLGLAEEVAALPAAAE